MPAPRFLQKQGFLTKGVGMKSNKRYFILTMRTLLWFKTKQDCEDMEKEQGKIDLSDPRTEVSVPTQKKIKKEVYSFQIIVPASKGGKGKTYDLFADSPEEYHEWLRAISHNIVNSRIPTHATAGKEPEHSPQRAMLQLAALGTVTLQNHAGWLYRKSKRKYVRLDSLSVSYATDKPPKGKVEGLVCMAGAVIERLEGPSFRIHMPESTLGPSTFDFDADSVQAREEWIGFIEGNQRMLEETFRAHNPAVDDAVSGTASGGGTGKETTGFVRSLPYILKPFASEMGEGVIPDGFKAKVTELSKEVLRQAKINTKILKESLESPVIESHLQEDSGSMSQTRENGSRTLEKKDKSVTVRTADKVIVKRNKQGAVLRKIPAGDVFQSTANGDVIHKKPDGHQIQVTEGGTLLFLVDPDETSIQIDLTDFSVIVVNDDQNFQVEVDMEEGFTLEIKADNTKVKEFKDGCKVIVSPDGTKTQYNPDGSKIEFDADGGRVDTDANGRVVRKVQAEATKVQNEVKVVEFRSEAEEGPIGLVLRRGVWDNRSRIICSGIVADTQADLSAAVAVGDVLTKIGETDVDDKMSATEAMQAIADAPKPVDVTFVSYADEEDSDLALEAIYPCPTHFREVFEHDDIIMIRRRYVEFVQDGGVPIESLGELDIEDEVVDDLLNKHRQDPKAQINFGVFLAAKLESDKYAAIRQQSERDAETKEKEAQLRAEVKRLKMMTEALESGGAAARKPRPRKTKSKASFVSDVSAPAISEEEQRQLDENLKAMGLAAPEDDDSDEEAPPPPPPE